MNVVNETRITELNKSPIISFTVDIAILDDTQAIIETTKKIIPVGQKMGLISVKKILNI